MIFTSPSNTFACGIYSGECAVRLLYGGAGSYGPRRQAGHPLPDVSTNHIQMRILPLLFAFAPLPAMAAGGLLFSGNSLKVLQVDAEPSTGLEQIYVAYNLNGVSASFSSATPVKWLRFSNLGGGFAEEIQGIIHNGDQWTLPSVQGDTGYIIEEADGRQHCFWVVDYSAHRLSLSSVAPSAVQDCDASLLEVQGSGAPIHYFTVLGQQKVLSRDLEVSYQSLVWNEKKNQFDVEPLTATFQSLSSELRVVPPALCQTVFTLSGDRFLKQWNWGEEVSTEAVPPTSVEVHTDARQSNSELPAGEKSNIVKTEDGSGLGGSAPVDISFSAWTSDAVIHNEWQMGRDATFGNIEYRFNQQDLDYTFMEEGTFYLRFVGSNSDGSCRAVSPVYTVSIGGSELRIPNAFSPNGDGVNDEWKVAYRSLLSFECWIVDRYGNQVAHLTSPDQGWDGRRGGKLAPPGVYYYVITAKGADGKDYKESGDINILRSESVSGTQLPQ